MGSGEQKAPGGQPPPELCLAGSSWLRARLGQRACRGCSAEGKWQGLLPAQREVTASRDRQEEREEATARRQLQGPAGREPRGLLSPQPAGSPPPRRLPRLPSCQAEPHPASSQGLVLWHSQAAARPSHAGGSRRVQAAGKHHAQPGQLLERLILNEAAEHGEGSEGLVRGHHVAGSLQGTGRRRGVSVPPGSERRSPPPCCLPAAQPAAPCPHSAAPHSPTLTVRKAMLVNSFTKPPIWFSPPTV